MGASFLALALADVTQCVSDFCYDFERHRANHRVLQQHPVVLRWPPRRAQVRLRALELDDARQHHLRHLPPQHAVRSRFTLFWQLDIDHAGRVNACTQACLVRRHRAEAVLFRPARSCDEEEVVRRAAQGLAQSLHTVPNVPALYTPTSRLDMARYCVFSSDVATAVLVRKYILDRSRSAVSILSVPEPIRGDSGSHSQISPCHFITLGHQSMTGDPHRASLQLGRTRPRHPFSSNLPRSSVVHSPRSRYACSASHAPFCVRTRATTVRASR